MMAGHLVQVLSLFEQALDIPKQSEKYPFLIEAYYLSTLVQQRSTNSQISKVAEENAITIQEEGDIPLLQPLNFEDLDSLRHLVIELLEQQGFTREDLENPDMVDVLLKDYMSAPSSHEARLAGAIDHADMTFCPRDMDGIYDLILQVDALVKKTLLLQGRTPHVVVVGRSLSWFVKMYEMLPPGTISFSMQHILGSQIGVASYTEPQKAGYKKYLDSCGMDRLTDNDEVIFLDVTESGRTLKGIQALFQEFYPHLKGHTQHIGVVYGTGPLWIPQTRFIQLPDYLCSKLLAKHIEGRIYCPFPSLYPVEWPRHEEILGSFKVHDAALHNQQLMTDWVHHHMTRLGI